MNDETDKFYLNFWTQAALYAMQGIQESGNYIGTIVDFTPKILAVRSFDIADAMLDELKKRTYGKEIN